MYTCSLLAKILFILLQPLQFSRKLLLHPLMEQESSGARAAALASDWFYHGRIRGIDEIRAAIEGITTRSILDYLQRHPPGGFTVVTLGPKALEVRTV